MVISRKHRPLPHASLQLGNTTLERVYKYMYLGVTITAELCWSEHIHTKCSKAKKLVGLLHRRFQSNTDPTMLFNLYIALIRPHLEYACEVWNPHLQKDKMKLEQVQKFGLRMCTKKWNADYGYLLTLFDIPPLEHRRLCLSLCTTYKIINKLVDFSQHIFVSKSTSNLRSSKNTSLLLQPFARTIAYQFSYVPHSCSVWNTLPKHITESQSLAAFKKLLLRHILSLF